MPKFAAMVVGMMLMSSAAAALPSAVVLERAVPLKGISMPELRKMDRARHAKTAVVNFSVGGGFVPFVKRLYYTSVRLGNPPKMYTFTIDTGSSIPWVACNGCTGCSQNLYNPDSSSTSSRISCSDHRCKVSEQSGSGFCRTQSGLCGYDLKYGDQTRVSGYYVSDTMYFNTITGNQSSANSSASVVFGCINSQSNFLETDGLLGFGQDPLSIISQLNSQGVSPKSFSHCLKGSEDGGGTLVLGKIVAPGLVYTPLVPSQSLYTLNLERIAVNGQKVPIDSSVFTTSDSQGTVVDSGTTLAYLVDGAHGPLVSAIIAASSSSVRYMDAEWNGKGGGCFLSSNRIDLLYPTVTLYFKGGAAMTAKPSQYLVRQGTNGNDTWWCIGWQSSDDLQGMQGITILGDIVLHDKLIVYDLGKGQLGWTDYNCSSLNMMSKVDVSSTSTYHSGGMIAIGVAAIWLGSLLL
uniref:Uncharacterized protein n=2 Tax=Avena sativa TaxID=4498 RepID=A0ACD5WJ96_AVESA